MAQEEYWPDKPYGEFRHPDGKLHIFMSSKFHHGHASHLGFKIEDHGSKKGKIVRVKEGTMEADENSGSLIDLSITKTVFAIWVSRGKLQKVCNHYWSHLSSL